MSKRSQVFYRCEKCGNIIGVINDAGVKMVCCGEEMKELVANTVDAAKEKHVPVAVVEGDKVLVKVGDVAHPMLEEHFIEWVYLETERGGQRKSLNPGEEPAISFSVVDDKPLAVFAYCNLHGLWKTTL